jgi:hypothetical protein
MGRARTADPKPPGEREPRDYTHLPDRVRPQDMTTTQEVAPAPDPQGGRDTETDFMLRYAGF